MTKETDDLGKKGEKLARNFLRRQGYRIRALNYSCPQGEIDIIAQDRKTIAFVEVRTLSSGKYGPPFETVRYGKRCHATRAALHYLYRYKLQDRDWRFDVVGSSCPKKGTPRLNS